MLKKITALMIGLGMLLLAENVFSQTLWSGNTYITKLVAYPSALAFTTEFSDPNYSTCDNGSRFQLNPSDEDYKIRAAVLTAAFLANKPIAFTYKTTAVNCSPLITSFIVTY